MGRRGSLQLTKTVRYQLINSNEQAAKCGDTMYNVLLNVVDSRVHSCYLSAQIGGEVVLLSSARVRGMWDWKRGWIVDVFGGVLYRSSVNVYVRVQTRTSQG